MKQQCQLSDAVDDFLRHRAISVGKNTLKQDKSCLTKFLSVTGNIWVHTISHVHVIRFHEEASKTKQPQSLRNDHTILAGFFEWARKTKRMAHDNDPMYGIRKPKRAHRERNRLHVSKFPALLDAAEARCKRDRVALALLLYTLGRDGEITDLRIRDVELDAGYLKYRVHKSGAEDRMPICAELDAELRSWLTYYTSEVGFLEPHFYLVPSRDTKGVLDGNGQICRNEQVRLVPDRRIPALGKIVTPVLDAIGFPTKDEHGRPCGEGAHTVRRSGARALFDSLVSTGYDHALRVVQSMLHHSSMITTEAYIGVTADRRTRDDLIKGQTMYTALEGVTELRREA